MGTLSRTGGRGATRSLLACSTCHNAAHALATALNMQCTGALGNLRRDAALSAESKHLRSGMSPSRSAAVCRVNMGTADEFALDVLINALDTLSREYAPASALCLCPQAQ